MKLFKDEMLSVKAFVVAHVNAVLERYNLFIGRDVHSHMPSEKLFTFGPTYDPIRLSTLELAAREINRRHVPGAIAELGVYRGGFAKYISQAFPARQFYLFDTFEGFDTEQASVDKSRGFTRVDKDFSATTEQLIRGMMFQPQRCIIKKGCFPETTLGVEATFAFVSIDCDLYLPILDGLKFFYERLSPGGFIFVHDYSNSKYLGARAAVNEFCDCQGITIVPLPDCDGTAVITK